MNSVFNLPDGQVMFFEEFEQQKNCDINSASQKVFGASWSDISLPEWQAVKMTFFAPCIGMEFNRQTNKFGFDMLKNEFQARSQGKKTRIW